MKNTLRLLSIGIFSIFLFACSTLPKDSTSDFNLKTQQKRIKSLKDWQIKGRMAFKSETQKNFSAYISWIQQKEQYDFSMNTLLGVSLLKLKGDDDFATITVDDETQNSNAPNQLIEALTGWDIPLLSMKDWIKGMPDNQSKPNRVLNKSLDNTTELDDLGRISSFQHNSGWHITYNGYRRIKDHWLHHQVILKSATSQIKIRITEWTI